MKRKKQTVDKMDFIVQKTHWIVSAIIRIGKNSVYYIVDASGDLDEDGEDSKISCTKMRLLKKN